MDDLDQRRITHLGQNGRWSISDLALERGVSRATVRSRLECLEQSGDIIGYTVTLRSDAVSLPIRGITLIEVERRAADRVVDALRGFPEISAIHTTNGTWDLIVELDAAGLSEPDAILRRIRLIAGAIERQVYFSIAADTVLPEIGMIALGNRQVVERQGAILSFIPFTKPGLSQPLGRTSRLSP
jgi:DNA-binding Lrp family transcriptional regulator